MDTETLISIKNNKECLELNNDILNKIKTYFKESNIKYVKKNKKINNVFKNSNFNLKKNKINNKFIFILNKLSSNNLEKITIEFIENINIVENNDYDIIQETIFNKILKDNKFINIYSDFFIYVIKIIYKRYNLKPIKILNIIDNYFNNFQDKEEIERNIFLNFISILIEKNMFNNDIIDVFKKKILQLEFIPDLKFWYKKYDLDISELKNIKCNNIRDKLMYESIFDNVNTNTKIIEDNIKYNEVEEKDNDNEFLIQCNNIIDEFIYLKMNDEVLYFIENNCNSFGKKIKFLEKIMQYYIKNNNSNNNIDYILELINLIINKKLIQKNIFQKSIKKINMKNNSNLKKILLLFKKNSITKNIEDLYYENNINI